MAAVMQSLGVGKGDRVLIYMPMIAEATFAMLACARIGAIHSVVFGGFASGSLATRIDDATPKLIVSSDAGMRGGKAVPYKHLLDDAIALAEHKPAKVLMIDRGLDKDFSKVEGRDVDYATLRAQFMDADVPVTWLESSEPSYILYTSGTTGKPKGVQRDTGGYAVALAASMKHIYCGGEGETMFSTSDIGWVVGHSYIVYGPLIAGMCTIMYEGTPMRPDPGIWWQIVEKYKVNVMFSAPTAARVLKKHDTAYMHKYDLSSLKHLFLAGEPLDQPTHEWIMGELKLPVIDNYWQTETGWPMLAAMPGVEKTEIRFGTPSFPVYGYDLQDLPRGRHGLRAGREGHRRHRAAAAAGLPVDGLGRRRALRFNLLLAVQGAAGLFVVRLGHQGQGRLSLHPRPHRRRDQRRRPSSRHARNRGGGPGPSGDRRSGRGRRRRSVEGPDADGLCGGQGCGQSIATPEKRAALEKAVFKQVDDSLGAIARPSRVHFLTVLPKTRSGKLLRRSIQALAEGRDPGDLTTIEDPAALEQLQQALGFKPA